MLAGLVSDDPEEVQCPGVSWLVCEDLTVESLSLSETTRHVVSEGHGKNLFRRNYHFLPVDDSRHIAR
jgi:hypothetical protein